MSSGSSISEFDALLDNLSFSDEGDAESRQITTKKYVFTHERPKGSGRQPQNRAKSLFEKIRLERRFEAVGSSSQFWLTTLNNTVSLIDVAFLTLPNAVNDLGIAGFTVLNLLFCVLSCAGKIAIVSAADASHSFNLRGIGAALKNERLGVLVELLQLIATVFVLFALAGGLNSCTKLFVEVVGLSDGASFFSWDDLATVLLGLLICLPVALVDRLSKLSPYSILAAALLGAFLLLTLIVSVLDAADRQNDCLTMLCDTTVFVVTPDGACLDAACRTECSADTTSFALWDSRFSVPAGAGECEAEAFALGIGSLPAVGMVMMAWAGHTSTLLLFKDMKERSVRGFALSVVVSNALAFVFYEVVGVLFALVYGRFTAPNVLATQVDFVTRFGDANESLGTTEASVALSLVLCVLGIIVLIPLRVVSCRESFVTLAFRGASVGPEVKITRRRSVVITAVIVVVTLVSSLFIPGIFLMVTVAGIVEGALLMQFTAGSLLFVAHREHRGGRAPLLPRWVARTEIVTGVVFAAAGIAGWILAFISGMHMY